jgi:hypothetical protein
VEFRSGAVGGKIMMVQIMHCLDLTQIHGEYLYCITRERVREDVEETEAKEKREVGRSGRQVTNFSVFDGSASLSRVLSDFFLF